jgi:hypothetical protein
MHLFYFKETTQRYIQEDSFGRIIVLSIATYRHDETIIWFSMQCLKNHNNSRLRLESERHAIIQRNISVVALYNGPI